MDELELGPNGGLVYCMEYLLDNMDWLKDELDKFDDDEYIIFDCPGQVLNLVGFNLFSTELRVMPLVMDMDLRVVESAYFLGNDGVASLFSTLLSIISVVTT